MSSLDTPAELEIAHQKTQKKLSRTKKDILEIVSNAHKRGIVDMTATEIQRLYEQQPGKLGGARGRVGDGHFAGRVSEMVRDGWLLRSIPRQCRDAKGRHDVKTVLVPIELSQNEAVE